MARQGISAENQTRILKESFGNIQLKCILFEMQNSMINNGNKLYKVEKQSGELEESLRKIINTVTWT